MLTKTEMLRRIREKDWSKTPLRSPSHWSPSLKIAVDLILASGFPMAVRWGPELVMIYNDAYVPILGDKHPDALGVPLRAVWSEIYDELGPLSEAILKGERGAFFKKDHLWRIRRHRDVWEDARFTISYSPIADDQAENGIGGILTTCVETTERVEGERKLLDHTHTLEKEVRERILERDRIWELSDDLLGVSNFEGYFTSVNPAWSRLLGWDEKEIKRMHVSELRHPDDAAVAMQQRTRLAEGVRTVHIENRFRHKNGSWKWLKWTLTAEAGHIYMVGRDVTAAIYAEEKLRESERQFRLFVEGVVDYALFRLDRHGVVSSWNTGAERIKGYSRDEIIGQHFSRFYTEADRKNLLPQKALETAALTGKYEMEGWRLRKDGTAFWANVVINSIRNDEGEVIGFAKVTRDLTERRAAEERLRQSQKMEGIGQLTGGVAHDFNNLLTVIIGNLQTLQRGLDESAFDHDAMRRSVENALRGARRAEGVTQRLLAFSRQQPLEPRALDISRLINDVCDLLRRTLGEHITVKTVLPGGLWRAHADRNQLEVAIVNLAVNSRDAMANGGTLTIETGNVHLDERYASAQTEVLPGEYVMLAVSDNGSGMTADIKAKAFDPFFTTKDIGQGTGLGLSQVYGFVKQSGGHVKIYSEVGEGTSVKMYLPRAHALAHEDERELKPSAAAPRGAPHETILVVEDENDVRSYATDTLRELGYQVLEATNAEGALRVLDHHPEVNVLFTDVGLPGGMNGRRLAEEVRKRRPGVKVLFTTGYARNAIVHHGRLDPGVELLPKPFTQAALAEKLREVIAAKSPPARVLVVEDETMIQMLAQEYLEKAGLKVEVAGSATEALYKLRSLPGGVDAVVIDLGLPDRKGDAVVREIRAIYPSLPLVIASGRGEDQLRVAFKEMAPISVVSKPYTAQTLMAGLQAVGIHGSPFV